MPKHLNAVPSQTRLQRESSRSVEKFLAGFRPAMRVSVTSSPPTGSQSSYSATAAVNLKNPQKKGQQQAAV